MYLSLHGGICLELVIYTKYQLLCQVTYLLALADEAWEAASKVDMEKKRTWVADNTTTITNISKNNTNTNNNNLKKRKAWLADLAFKWSGNLYGQEHEETMVWKERLIRMKEDKECKLANIGRRVKAGDGWKAGGRKRNLRIGGRLKRRR